MRYNPEYDRNQDPGMLKYMHERQILGERLAGGALGNTGPVIIGTAGITRVYMILPQAIVSNTPSEFAVAHTLDRIAGPSSALTEDEIWNGTGLTLAAGTSDIPKNLVDQYNLMARYGTPTERSTTLTAAPDPSVPLRMIIDQPAITPGISAGDSIRLSPGEIVQSGQSISGNVQGTYLHTYESGGETIVDTYVIIWDDAILQGVWADSSSQTHSLTSNVSMRVLTAIPTGLTHPNQSTVTGLTLQEGITSVSPSSRLYAVIWFTGPSGGQANFSNADRTLMQVSYRVQGSDAFMPVSPSIILGGSGGEPFYIDVTQNFSGIVGGSARIEFRVEPQGTSTQLSQGDPDRFTWGAAQNNIVAASATTVLTSNIQFKFTSAGGSLTFDPNAPGSTAPNITTADSIRDYSALIPAGTEDLYAVFWFNTNRADWTNADLNKLSLRWRDLENNTDGQFASSAIEIINPGTANAYFRVKANPGGQYPDSNFFEITLRGVTAPVALANGNRYQWSTATGNDVVASLRAELQQNAIALSPRVEFAPVTIPVGNGPFTRPSKLNDDVYTSKFELSEIPAAGQTLIAAIWFNAIDGSPLSSHATDIRSKLRFRYRDTNNVWSSLMDLTSIPGVQVVWNNSNSPGGGFFYVAFNTSMTVGSVNLLDQTGLQIELAELAIVDGIVVGTDRYYWTYPTAPDQQNAFDETTVGPELVELQAHVEMVSGSSFAAIMAALQSDDTTTTNVAGSGSLNASLPGGEQMWVAFWLTEIGQTAPISYTTAPDAWSGTPPIQVRYTTTVDGAPTASLPALTSSGSSDPGNNQYRFMSGYHMFRVSGSINSSLGADGSGYLKVGILERDMEDAAILNPGQPGKKYHWNSAEHVARVTSANNVFLTPEIEWEIDTNPPSSFAVDVDTYNVSGTRALSQIPDILGGQDLYLTLRFMEGATNRTNFFGSPDLANLASSVQLVRYTNPSNPTQTTTQTLSTLGFTPVVNGNVIYVLIPDGHAIFSDWKVEARVNGTGSGTYPLANRTDLTKQYGWATSAIDTIQADLNAVTQVSANSFIEIVHQGSQDPAQALANALASGSPGSGLNRPAIGVLDDQINGTAGQGVDDVIGLGNKAFAVFWLTRVDNNNSIGNVADVNTGNIKLKYSLRSTAAGSYVPDGAYVPVTGGGAVTINQYTANPGQNFFWFEVPAAWLNNNELKLEVELANNRTLGGVTTTEYNWGATNDVAKVVEAGVQFVSTQFRFLDSAQVEVPATIQDTQWNNRPNFLEITLNFDGVSDTNQIHQHMVNWFNILGNPNGATSPSGWTAGAEWAGTNNTTFNTHIRFTHPNGAGTATQVANINVNASNFFDSGTNKYRNWARIDVSGQFPSTPIPSTGLTFDAYVVKDGTNTQPTSSGTATSNTSTEYKWSSLGSDAFNLTVAAATQLRVDVQFVEHTGLSIPANPTTSPATFSNTSYALQYPGSPNNQLWAMIQLYNGATEVTADFQSELSKITMAYTTGSGGDDNIGASNTVNNLGAVWNASVTTGGAILVPMTAQGPVLDTAAYNRMRVQVAEQTLATFINAPSGMKKYTWLNANSTPNTSNSRADRIERLNVAATVNLAMRFLNGSSADVPTTAFPETDWNAQNTGTTPNLPRRLELRVNGVGTLSNMQTLVAALGGAMSVGFEHGGGSNAASGTFGNTYHIRLRFLSGNWQFVVDTGAAVTAPASVTPTMSGSDAIFIFEPATTVWTSVSGVASNQINDGRAEKFSGTFTTTGGTYTAFTPSESLPATGGIVFTVGTITGDTFVIGPNTAIPVTVTMTTFYTRGTVAGTALENFQIPNFSTVTTPGVTQESSVTGGNTFVVGNLITDTTPSELTANEFSTGNIVRSWMSGAQLNFVSATPPDNGNFTVTTANTGADTLTVSPSISSPSTLGPANYADFNLTLFNPNDKWNDFRPPQLWMRIDYTYTGGGASPDSSTWSQINTAFLQQYFGAGGSADIRLNGNTSNVNSGTGSNHSITGAAFTSSGATGTYVAMADSYTSSTELGGTAPTSNVTFLSRLRKAAGTDIATGSATATVGSSTVNYTVSAVTNDSFNCQGAASVGGYTIEAAFITLSGSSTQIIVPAGAGNSNWANIPLNDQTQSGIQTALNRAFSSMTSGQQKLVFVGWAKNPPATTNPDYSGITNYTSTTGVLDSTIHNASPDSITSVMQDIAEEALANAIANSSFPTAETMWIKTKNTTLIGSTGVRVDIANAGGDTADKDGIGGSTIVKPSNTMFVAVITKS